MFRPIKFINFLLGLNLFFLIACSGGTGGTGANSGGSNVVVGTITQIGTPSPTAAQSAASQQIASAVTTAGSTVTINGVQFDVSSSAITLDGLGGTESDLRVGMVATVQGTVNTNGTTGTANSLSVKEVIKGPVTDVNKTNNTITVLGQTVQTSTATHWDNVADITGINVDNIIEVSGFVKNNNVIAATRIELLNNSQTEFKVTGSISSVPTATTFDLGSLSVDYSSATLNNIPNNTPVSGMYVEVKGTLLGSQLVATEVGTEKLDVSDADSVELQGFVISTSGTPVTGFSVNHQPVQFDSSTQFSGGAATDIVAGVLVSVQGPLVNGILIANQVSFEDTVKITAVVNAINSVNNTFTLSGLDTLNISVDASTEFDGNITAITSSEKGYTVTIHGNLAPPNNVVATQISLDSTSPSTDVSFKGPIDAIASNYSSVTILGVSVDTSMMNPDADFVVEGTTNTSKIYFFSLVTTGDVVIAQGTLAGSVITWNSLTYEIPSN